MNKREVIWLIIRLIGVYFAFSAVFSVISLLGSIFSYASMPAVAGNPAATRNNAETTRPPRSPQFPNVVNNAEINSQPVVAPKTEADVLAERAKSDAFKLIFWFVFLTALYGGLGWYLIRDGRYLFALLSREDDKKMRKRFRRLPH